MATTTIHTCDICGVVINTDEVSKLDMVYCAYKFDENQIPRSIHYDICPKCTAKISNYLRNFKDEFNER